MIRRSDPLAHPERLIRRVYAYVAYRMGDGQDAEDVTSETFERALRYRGSYDRAKGEPITWLLGIARRCVDGALAPSHEIPGDVPERADDGALEEHAVTRIALAGALARLSPRDRELVALRYGADLTAAAIADVMEMSTNAVEVALHRALERLRAYVEAPGDDEAAKSPVRVQGSVPVSRLEGNVGPTGEAA
jgi:RNA polymerase sigma-70 factor (ECF subfamily)